MKTISGIVCLLITLLFSSFALAQGVGINTTGASPDPSAMLDVSSSSQGVLISRMTQAQRDAISNPATGLQIYNTDSDCINMYNGLTWKQACFDCDFALPTIGNNGPICEGSTLNLTASTVSGATYSWTGPNGFSSSDQNPSITNVTTSANGAYSLVVTLNGCSASPISMTATINGTPQTPVAGSNSPVCVGANLNLSASNIVGATYSWTGPNGFTANTQNPILSNVTAIDAGNYNVVATVDGCASASGSTTAVVNQIPSAPTAASNSPVCENQTLNLTATTVSGATYSWTGPNGFASIDQNPSIVNVPASGAGNYNVTATVNGCTSSAGTVGVTVNAAPTGTQTFNYTGSIEDFSVPGCIYSLTIEAWGAQGGDTYSSSHQGGLGARMKGDFSVTPASLLKIVVGGEGGSSSTYRAGGGGGSFVWLNGSSSPMLIAGGGGGAGECGSNHDGKITEAAGNGSNTSPSYPGGAGGTGGNGGAAGPGGNSAGTAGGGAGWNTDGQGIYPGKTKYDFQGGQGTVVGGFGGGGGSGNSGGAGGGGYSGGGGSGWCSNQNGSGGGGGSYNVGANQNNSPGVRTGNGQVTITW